MQVPFASITHPGMGPIASPHCQGPVGAAGTGSDFSGRDAPRYPALAPLQPLV